MAETKNDVNLRIGALVDLASLSAAEKAVGSFSDKIVNLAKWAGAAIAGRFRRCSYSAYSRQI